MRFASNLLKTYKSLLKTSFCVKNFLLPNYKEILLKNAFCFTSAQRIARCVENSVSRHFVLNFLLLNYEDILLKNAFLIKSAQNIQIAVENFISCQKLPFAKL